MPLFKNVKRNSFKNIKKKEEQRKLPPFSFTIIFIFKIIALTQINPQLSIEHTKLHHSYPVL